MNKTATYASSNLINDINNHIIILNANPGHIEKIEMVSKSFSTFVNINEDILINSKFGILMPHIISEIH